MKKSLIGAGLALALSAGVALPAAAEARIAVVDMAKVFQSLPQREEVGKKLEKEFADRIEAVRKLEDQMKDIQDKAHRDASIMTDSQKTDLSRKMEQLQADYQLKRKALDEDMRNRQGEERNKLLDTIQKAVDAVAKGKYDVVLQRAAVAYISNDVDISDKVIAQVSKGK
ncbi:OmpH family outer membrane protein [Gallaecimonas kandeliae]|uniref:OmpH family outer membrane protein n=1 Tax=Gallaecimonas kandeliae TaxID=3029055 RepID=UPI00264908ED|nr:OmpH family outer membrane protein [Gallaecimonas kandeliae]WKE64518.1 OmpH family outer membrane protein [Gallaecimonas kandeliae]